LLAACTCIVTSIPFWLRPGEPEARTLPTNENFGYAASDTYGESAIFYNAYFAPDNEENGLRIVKEQLDQISEQLSQNAANEAPDDLDRFVFAMKEEKEERLVTIYFDTAGSPVLSPIFLQKLCSPRNMTCTLLNHYDEPNEEVTLQNLYEFCQSAEDSTRVAYVYNMGSLDSNNGANEVWRRHLTAAAMAGGCWDPPENGCNVCGLQFWPIWTPFFPGNMWTAKCDYVRKLLPPIDFEAKMKSMYDESSTLQAKGVLTNHLFPNIKRKKMDNVSMRLFGLERFAMEHWVGSHPFVAPCDMAGVFAGNLSAWNQSGGANESDFVWNMAPHAPFRPVDYWSPFSESNVDHILAHKGHRMREYFVLPGQLFKWVYLYNQVPPIDSWAMTWYPDRVEWRKRVRKLGVNILGSIKRSR
jgi:hypothetical protein